MAGIIKSTGTQEPTPSGVFKPFQFDDVGDSYLKRVRGEAARIVADAQKQATQVKAKAQLEGQQAAIEAAQAAMRSQLDQQLQNVLAALQAASEQIIHSRHAWQQLWERQTVALATALARRICRQELATNPQISREWIREALELAIGSGAVILRLNPADHGALRDHVEAIAARLAGIGGIQIVADPAVESGGCRVDTEFGSIDQQLETQLARLTEELLG